DVHIRYGGVPHRQVVSDGALKHKDLLVNHSDGVVQQSWWNLLSRDPVEQDFSAPLSEKAGHDLGGGGFTAAAPADQGNPLSGLDGEAQVLDQWRAKRIETEADVSQFHMAAQLNHVIERGIEGTPLEIGRIAFVAENVIQPIQIGAGFLQCVSKGNKSRDRLGETVHPRL